MEHVSVKLPTQLEHVIEEEADRVGQSKAEKIRNDLLNLYDEDLKR